MRLSDLTTKEEIERYWNFALCLKLDAKFLEFMIMENMPKKLKFPVLNNHIKRIRESAEAIKKEAGYSLTCQNEDYGDDQMYAMYRIYNNLRFADKDELERIAEDLDSQRDQISELKNEAYGNLHKELMTELYSLKEPEDKKRILNLIKKIKREKKELV